MKKKLFVLILFASSIFVSGQSFNGFALYNPQGESTTYLIDENENVAHEWALTTECNYAVALKENGNLVRGTKNTPNILGGAAAGGRVQEIAPDGTIVWDYIYSDADHLSHHDLTLIGDNVLLTAWEVKTAAEVNAAGGNAALGTAPYESWPTHFIELEPDGNGGANIVWEWHIWDHMCQTNDPSKPNYVTNISDHPELIDIDMLNNHIGDEDWFHVNGVDYNEDLDQIVFSSRFASEIYIIDHSTTTQEAASHDGGNSGMGGDILYRWGNPSNYGFIGQDQVITSAVHDARWITDDGRPNGGFLQIFNNCAGNGGCSGGGGPGGGGGSPTANSTIDGIETPWDPSTNKYLRTNGEPFEPTSFTTRYECEYSSSGQSASDRMSNGNIYVNASGGQGGAGVMYEVDAATEQIIWGPYQASSQKGFRYECDYPGIIALESYMYLNPPRPITTSCFQSAESWDCDGAGECKDPGDGTGQYSTQNDCQIDCSQTSVKDMSNRISIYPNPTNRDIIIELQSYSEDITVKLYNTLGKEVYNKGISSFTGVLNERIGLEDYSEGVYILHIINNTGQLYTKQISYIK